MSATTPWYPTPTEEEAHLLSPLLARLGADEPGETDFQQLVGLSRRDWPESDLRRIGKLIAAKSVVGTWEAYAAQFGFVHSRLLVISSDTVSHLLHTIAGAALRHGICLQVEAVEYVQPEAWLAQQSSQARYDAVLLALNREDWGLDLMIGDAGRARSAVDGCINRAERLVRDITKNISPFVLVQNLPFEEDVFHSQLDLAFPGSERNLVARFNMDMAAFLASSGHAILDKWGLTARLGAEQWHPGRMRHQAKLPLSTHTNIPFADSIGRLIAVRHGKSKRVLVLDLDNTLWKGVIGDDGLDGIQMAPGHPIGEAHRAIQQMALHAQRRGVVLCVASKNTHEIAIQAFRNHPDMLLKEDAITLFRIDWNDKARNIEDMARTLNLGLDSFVFIDDNPAERLQVRERLPTVFVPELPQDVSLWPRVLGASGCFEQISMTEEDLQRAYYYTSNAKRDEALNEAANLSDFLHSLKMTLQVQSFNERGRTRIAQLVAKSNQFNLTTRRYSENEIAGLETDHDAITLQIRLSDRFGDNGMIAAVVANREGSNARINLWIMSCRVLSRKVEEATLNVLVERCRQAGVTGLVGCYIPTARNGIVKDHYANLGFEMVSREPSGRTEWFLSLDSFEPFDAPMHIATE